MTESDRYTNPKDAGWHAVQSTILTFAYVLAIGIMVRFAMAGPGIYEGFQ